MKSNNVKNNNYMNYMMNNKIIKMEKWDNNYKNPFHIFNVYECKYRKKKRKKTDLYRK